MLKLVRFLLVSLVVVALVVTAQSVPSRRARELEIVMKAIPRRILFMPARQGLRELSVSIRNRNPSTARLQRLLSSAPPGSFVSRIRSSIVSGTLPSSSSSSSSSTREFNSNPNSRSNVDPNFSRPNPVPNLNAPVEDRAIVNNPSNNNPSIANSNPGNPTTRGNTDNEANNAPANPTDPNGESNPSNPSNPDPSVSNNPSDNPSASNEPQKPPPAEPKPLPQQEPAKSDSGVPMVGGLSLYVVIAIAVGGAFLIIAVILVIAHRNKKANESARNSFEVGTGSPAGRNSPRHQPI